MSLRVPRGLLAFVAAVDVADLLRDCGVWKKRNVILSLPRTRSRDIVVERRPDTHPIIRARCPLLEGLLTLETLLLLSRRSLRLKERKKE